MFLATTALEQYWDTTKPIAFLGEWCLLRARRSMWQPLNGQLLESPFDSEKKVHAAHQYVEGIYERILPLLVDVLNSMHGERRSLRFWRIVLGPWLQLYLSVTYDRYAHLKRAIEEYPDCETVVLAKESFVVASDSLDFAWRVKEDSFNLQVYTKLFDAMGMTFPCIALAEHTTTFPAIADPSWKATTLNAINNAYSAAAKIARPSIFLRSPHFSKSCELRLVLKTAGRVLPIVRPQTIQSLPAEDNNLRQNLPEVAFGDSEFEQCLSSILFSDMPRAYLEGFRIINHDAENLYPKNPTAIMSANAWHFDEVFKQWAASSGEKGALLIGTPHGGNYGGLADMPPENHETSIVDRYYSWGWERSDCSAQVIPFPATKFVDKNKIGASNGRTGILWATSSSPRYLVQFPFLPKAFYEYLAWQRRFATALHPKIVSVLRLRPHREDGGWQIAERIDECIPGLVIETWQVPFQKSLAKSRLYVCDHLSTTFVEALAADKPTILFWNPQANRLRATAQPYYDLLRKNGILFDTPEGAAIAVGEAYDDVEAWWNEPERKNSVNAFCERFARNSSDAIELWAAEFREIAAIRRPVTHEA